MHLIPALWNSHRPSVNLSVIVNCRQMLTNCNPSAKSLVIVTLQPLSMKCWRTCNSSVWTSVIVTLQPLSMKCWRTCNSSVWTSVIVAFPVNILQLSVKCQRTCNPSVWKLVIMLCACKIMFVLPIYLPANT
jgi:hypothetical protein